MKSRRIQILVLLLCIMSGMLSAQQRLRHPEMYLGAHAGVMASTMRFSPSVAGIDLMQSPLSVNGGLVFRYAGHKVCAVQVELNYMERGWLEATLTGTYQRKLDYIEIPLLMHLYFGKQHFRAFFNLGPQVGYCFRDVAYGEVIENAHHYEKIDNPFDWGVAGGLGIYYRTNKIGLFQLEARVNYSLGSIYSTSKIDYFNAANPINASINLAYLWEIK